MHAFLGENVCLKVCSRQTHLRCIPYLGVGHLGIHYRNRTGKYIGAFLGHISMYYMPDHGHTAT